MLKKSKQSQTKETTKGENEKKILMNFNYIIKMLYTKLKTKIFLSKKKIYESFESFEKNNFFSIFNDSLRYSTVQQQKQ